MKKKMISMFLAAMMTFSLGIVTYAADPETKSDLQKDSYGTEACDNSGEEDATQEYLEAKLRVNGKNVILEGGKQVGDMPDGMSYDDSTNTLTLNNCTLEQTDSETLSAIEFNSWYYSGNICGTKLTIVLIGDNTIYAPRISFYTLHNLFYPIYSDRNMIIPIFIFLFNRLCFTKLDSFFIPAFSSRFFSDFSPHMHIENIFKKFLCFFIRLRADCRMIYFCHTCSFPVMYLRFHT